MHRHEGTQGAPEAHINVQVIRPGCPGCGALRQPANQQEDTMTVWNWIDVGLRTIGFAGVLFGLILTAQLAAAWLQDWWRFGRYE